MIGATPAEAGGRQSSVDGRDRQRLERLCRYIARPPLLLERLEAHPERVFAIDILTCPRCQSAMRVKSIASEPRHDRFDPQGTHVLWRMNGFRSGARSTHR